MYGTQPVARTRCPIVNVSAGILRSTSCPYHATTRHVARSAFQVGSFTYTFVYVLLIFFFCYFWTAVVFNPLKMADEMKQYGHFVPGIRPGKTTAQYLERLMTRITLAGAGFLAFIAIIPQLMSRTTELGSAAYLYGGTGLLIVVGVALELVQKVESHLMMRHYEGFMKRGRIRSRSGR